ncbi:MAG: ATP-binding protein [Acidobacteriota bacterium]|nr:ATP-binding protein [Acidobacteriota bacterium]
MGARSRPELQFHIAEGIAALKSSGLSEDEARRQVRQEFGGVEQVKNAGKLPGPRWVETTVLDTQFPLRTLRRSPGFTLTAVASLALGIGANTAIFSVMNALMLRNLPVQRPDRLVVLGVGVSPGVTDGFPMGKSFVACALAEKACRDGYSALYTRAQSLFHGLAMARADGSLRSLLARLSRIDVLVIDDWAMASFSEPERRDFWEICEDRYQVRGTILTSQLPVSKWHEQIGDPTLADGILDRLVHNAHRIEMRGDSTRKNRGRPNA